MVKKYAVIISGFMFLILSLAATLAAEELADRVIELSLEDAIVFAFKNNKDIQIQEQEILVSRANILGARSQFLPQVNLNSSYTRNGAISPIQLNGKRDAGVFTGYKNENQFNVSVTDSIYNGGASIANFKQAKLDLSSQEETLRAKKLDIEFEARRLYYGLLLGYETQRITKELVDNAQAHYEDVKRKFEQGTSSRFDLLQSKVQVSLLIPELVKAENNVDLIMADLKKLLGFKQYEAVALKDKTLEYSLIEINEGEFLKDAYITKPEMTLKSLGIDISQWSIQMAKAGWRPQLNADAGYSYISNNWANMFNRKHNNWQAGVSVTLPIFDGFSTKAKVEAAKAKYAEANLSRGNLVDQIAVDIRQACLDLRQAEAIINSQKDNVEEAREALKIANVSYDNGESTNLDVLDAQVSLGQVEKNLSEGIYDYLIARAFLDRTIGISVFSSQADPPAAKKEAGNEEEK